ncbi:MAG: helix-turn-helix domain-containing protein [Promethearchaeota archaeon]
MKSNEETNSKIIEYLTHLMNFGISEDEAKVYLSLIKRGPRGEVVGRIKNELEIGRTTIYAIMERLSDKGFITAKEISQNPKRILYIANSPIILFNKIIVENEKKLDNQKQSNLFVGDNLEKTYQGAKKLNLETAHPGAYKYLKPLINKKFEIKSEVIEHSAGSEHKLSYDYELKGPKGFPKDSGLVIIEYDRNIEHDHRLIDNASEMFRSKTEYEIRKDKIPGFQDLKFVKANFGVFLGNKVLIKIKYKKNWWEAGYHAVIPLNNRIFFIFGAKENFQMLKEMILNSEKFHHLI